jgi:hypothetical protein
LEKTPPNGKSTGREPWPRSSRFRPRSHERNHGFFRESGGGIRGRLLISGEVPGDRSGHAAPASSRLIYS